MGACLGAAWGVSSSLPQFPKWSYPEIALPWNNKNIVMSTTVYQGNTYKPENACLLRPWTCSHDDFHEKTVLLALFTKYSGRKDGKRHNTTPVVHCEFNMTYSCK